MGAADFVTELVQLGFDPIDLGTGRVAIRYPVRLGRFSGETIRLGFANIDSFPLNPPQTPHVSPRLLPVHPGQEVPHPDGGINESDFGEDWEYWSRPIADWASDPSARHLVQHISDLFGKIP